jgi:hypothetical protein
LIADIIRRDLPIMRPRSAPAVAPMIRFSKAVGILNRDPSYDEIVAHHLLHCGFRKRHCGAAHVKRPDDREMGG